MSAPEGKAALKRFAGLLRAVNVGGTGKLPMADLRQVCAAAGFLQVQTLLASGNVVFSTGLDADDARAALEAGLGARTGKPVRAFLRSPADLRRVLSDNPFHDRDPSRTVAIFLDAAPPPDVAASATGRQDETIVPGRREIYVHYPSGLGRSRLRIPAAAPGTARNMNTVAKLAALAEDL